MRFVVKILVAIGLSLYLIQALFIKDLSFNTKYITKIKSFHFDPSYRYISKVNGEEFCKKPEERSTKLDFNFINDSRINLVILENVDILSCKDFIPEISAALHTSGKYLGVIAQKSVSKEMLLNSDGSFKEGYYTEKFKDLSELKNWIDYVILENDSLYLNFNERTKSLIELRNLFPRQFIGFTFTEDAYQSSLSSFKYRENMKTEEFIPRDYDGDFIITNMNFSNFKKTKVYRLDSNFNSDEVNGEFIVGK